jgi:RNA polymerase sigma factor (sigma-70 family)
MVNRGSEATREVVRGLLDASALLGLSDGQLLARFARQPDELAEVAFTALVHRHGPMVLRVCRQVVGDPHTAEDAFQATFLVLARRAGAIRRPELLGNWLYGVALRTAREARLRNERRRRHELTGGEDLADSLPGRDDWPERAVAGREELEVLHDEVSRLPERYRTAVILCELEGLDYREAALRMQCPVGTVGVRLRRARERLRVRLTRRGLAPTAAILGSLAGAEAALGWVPVPAALVGATAQAATQFAGTGLASGTIAVLATAILRNLAMVRLKTAVRTLLAVGAGAALGWFGVRHAASAWRPTAAPRVTSGIVVASASSPAVVPFRPILTADVSDRGPVRAATIAGSGSTAIATAIAAAPVQPVSATLMSRDPEVDTDTVTAGPGRVARLQPTAEPVPAATALPRHVREERTRGEALFAKEWVPDDPASHGHGGDGLGPVYNERSCIACHGQASPGGAGPEETNVIILTAAPVRGKPPGDLERVHPGFRNSQSIVLHKFGTHPDFIAWRQRFNMPRPEIASEPRTAPEPASKEETAEQRIERIRRQIRPGGRPRVRARVVVLQGGLRMTLTERNSPALFGAGEIDAIPSDVLVAVTERQPDQVRGRVGRTSRGAIGRFGWKAQVASLHEFVRAACASELGLEVPGHAQAVSPVGPIRKAQGVDMTQAECDALVAYVRGLPAPAMVRPSDPEARREITDGRNLFASVGCAECHRPSLGEVRGIFSDLLLHHMGTDLEDVGSGYGTEGRPLPDGPSPGEWRTPPLWGFRDSAPYLHDGRARNLEQAVAFHGGQGEASARQFFALSAPERAKVEAFLNALVAPTRAWVPAADQVPAPETEAEATAEAEVLVRYRRQRAVDREERQARVAEYRKRNEAAVTRARRELSIALKLDRLGKPQGALTFYRQIVRIAPDSEEGQVAADRISEITGGSESP